MTSTETRALALRPSGRALAFGLLAALSLAACDDGLGVGDMSSATVAFRVADARATTAGLPGPAGAPARTSPGPLRSVTVEGGNGTLVLEELHMIVSEVELDGGDCDDDDSDDDSDDDEFPCGDFESGARLVALPLDGAPIDAFDGTIAPGRYEELEFEIEDLEEDDDDDQEQIGSLRDEILEMVPDWPRRASLYVRGTFQPTGGDPVEFRTFVDAEIEIELEFDPALVIEDEDALLVVDVRPDLWFSDGQGGVIDLTAWDYDETGLVLELEVELEDGFESVEWEED